MRITNENWRDLAKFGAGIIFADFVGAVWIAHLGVLPMEFLGYTVTADVIVPTLIFDAAVFFILVHYGWHVGKLPTLRERSYLIFAGLAFSIIATVHLANVFLSADISIFGWTLPVWLSWLGITLATYLAFMSFHLARKMK